MTRFRLLPLLVAVATLGGCEQWLMSPDPSSGAEATFDYFCRCVDEHYSLFDVKSYDWDSACRAVRPAVWDGMRDEELFRLMADMLDPLEDGHVNLYADFDISHSQTLYRRMKEGHNFNADVVQATYLGYDYHTTGGFAHNVVRDGKVIYARYSSFVNSATATQVATLVDAYPEAEGLVIDMRQNGGGAVQNVWNLLRMLPNEKPMLYRTQIKSGSGRDEFSTVEEVFAPDADPNHAWYRHPVAVLIDRGSYSATSFFALACLQLAAVTTLGDTTGGGLGMPATYDLPNGWRLRLSVTRTLTPEGVNYENGVPPEIVASLDPEALAAGRDNLIEQACDFVLSRAAARQP